MEYNKFIDALINNRLLTTIWKEVITLIDNEMDDSNDKDDCLILFSILFSLIDDGNIAMSLVKDKLLSKWDDKLKGTRILLEDIGSLDNQIYDYIVSKSHDVISNSLTKLKSNDLSSVIGDNKLFVIEDDWIYLRKNNVARKLLLESIDRLFKPAFSNPYFDYTKITNDFRLTEGQANVLKQGLNKNLVITGGPGTGKTTSILFLLLELLLNKKDYEEIYLLAPSGKASSRMKDSIKGGLNCLTEAFKNEHPDIVDRIANLNRYTIHRLLGIDFETHAFKHNASFQLKKNSIYIIDEASMIDICLFASLLSAIPDGSRVFIMGDKNQLPSVDVGAVFGELINKKSLLDNGNICRLGEAVRFKIGSPIYILANAINNEDVFLPQLDWKNEFLTIQENKNNVFNPVYYFTNPISGSNYKEKDIVLKAVYNFGNAYFKNLQDMASDIPYDDMNYLKQLFEGSVKNASILCAENEGVRGTKSINAFIKSIFINKDKPTSKQGFYPGELIIINKNNKLLDLANGDSGILVTFKDDKTLYLMIEKDSILIKNNQKIDGKIFKLGGYMFYPLYLISSSDFSNAYAITIHKSQGSDYKNILVILPTKKGHPLLNRQIVYTAITRTKGDTYILSSQDRLLDAKNTIIKRDTNIA